MPGRFTKPDVRPIGDSNWLDYEYEVQTDDRAYYARGILLSQGRRVAAPLGIIADFSFGILHGTAIQEVGMKESG
jgi:hypothetical protein